MLERFKYFAILSAGLCLPEVGVGVKHDVTHASRTPTLKSPSPTQFMKARSRTHTHKHTDTNAHAHDDAHSIEPDTLRLAKPISFQSRGIHHLDPM